MVVLTTEIEEKELVLKMEDLGKIKKPKVNGNPDGDDESSSDDAESNEEDCEKDLEGEEPDNITMAKSQNQNLLSHFWNLASLDETARSESVVELLGELKKSGKQDDLDYTVQRLVKGLSSSRKAARQGFATALTQVMKEFDEVTSDVIIELMAKHLAVQGSFKGHEERDAYFGQLFGLLSIFQSKIQRGIDVNVTLVKQVIGKLLTLMKKKSYLQEICGIAICDLLKCIDYSMFEEIKSLLEVTLHRGWEKCIPEQVMIVLTVQSHFKELPKKYFKEHWHRSEILHKANFKEMTRVLMDTTNTAHPRVHSFWDTILAFLLSPDREEGTFENFWKTVVEDGFMHSTHERKFAVMNIILKVAPQLPVDKVPIIFGEIVIRCIINSCQSKMNYLYSCVQNMLQKLPEELSKNEDKDIIACVIKSLVGAHGHVGFDSITKTKVIEELTSRLSTNLPVYFNWLKEVFVAGTTDLAQEAAEIPEKEVNECRSWVANQLVSLLRSSKSQNDESLLMEVTNFLFFHAYFDILKKSKKDVLLQCELVNPVSETTHLLYRQRFNTAMTELANMHQVKPGSENKSSIGGISQDGEWFAWKILCLAKKLLEMPKYVQLVSPWTPEIYESWSHSLEKITKMQEECSETEEGTVNSKGTQLLFIHSTLQLFSNLEEAVDILKELDTCYEKAEEKKNRKKTEPHWTEVLTEILLGFMAQPSHLLRQVVDNVYPTIVPHLTQDALELLLKAIKPANEKDGLEFENESDMEEMEVEEPAEEKENIEGKDENSAEEDEEKEEAEDNTNVEKENLSESDSECSDEGSDFEIDEAFKAELKSALGDSAVNSEEEGEDNEEDEEDEEDIDMDTCDPIMMKAMDQALADVFKSRKQKKIEKKNKKDKKLSFLHFKLRVLDLIEIFIKRQPKDPKILSLIEPLYDLVKSSHGRSDQLPLFERTLGIFKNKLCNLHEYPAGTDLDVNGVHNQIEWFIELAKSASSALMVSYISQGIIYLIRVLRGTPEVKVPSPRATRAQRKKRETVKVENKTPHVGCLDESRLMGKYKEALIEFMTKKSSHLQPVMFNELIQRFPSLGWKLAVDLPQYLNDGCNNFRKVKALEMLKLLFSKKTDDYEAYVSEINKAMETNLIKAFQATAEENYSLKARQFHHMVQLGNIYIKEISKYPKLYKEIDRDSIKNAISESLESPVVSRSTALQSHCKSFISTLENTSKGKPPKKKKKKNQK